VRRFIKATMLEEEKDGLGDISAFNRLVEQFWRATAILLIFFCCFADTFAKAGKMARRGC
jgi:hypothetical protein